MCFEYKFAEIKIYSKNKSLLRTILETNIAGRNKKTCPQKQKRWSTETAKKPRRNTKQNTEPAYRKNETEVAFEVIRSTSS